MHAVVFTMDLLVSSDQVFTEKDLRQRIRRSVIACIQCIRNHQMRKVSELTLHGCQCPRHALSHQNWPKATARRDGLKRGEKLARQVRFSASITLELIGRPRSYSVRTDLAEAILSRTCLHDEKVKRQQEAGKSRSDAHRFS